MAEIDNLNFKVILDDNDFNKKIAAVTKAAQTLNTQVTTLLNFGGKGAGILNNMSDASDRAAKSMKDFASSAKAASNSANLAGKNYRKFADAAKVTNAELQPQAKLLDTLGKLTAGYFSVVGAERLVKMLASVTAEFEMQRVTLRAMLQDYAAADNIFSQIKGLAVNSPFTFKELITFTKQLSAYSIPINELYDTTKMLADVSAGLGVDMSRIVLAYGQIRSAAFLRGQEVRQLTEAGIPILTELRKQFEQLTGEVLTAGDVFDKISARQVPFEMVAKVFKDMTSEGGKFFNMQEIQSETLKGKWMKLKDAIDITLADIGEKQSGLLYGAEDVLLKMVRNYQTLGTILISVASSFGVYHAALLLARTGEKLWALDKTIKNVAALTERANRLGVDVSRATVAMRQFGITSKAAIAGALGIFTALTVAIVAIVKYTNELDNKLRDIAATKFDEASRSAEEFQRLAKRLNEATKGTQEYRDAIDELNRKYGDLLPNVLNESNAQVELKKNIDLVTEAIYKRAAAYAYEEGVREIEDKQGASVKKQYYKAKRMFEKYGVSSDDAKNFLAKFEEAVLDAANKNKNGSHIAAAVAKMYFGEQFSKEVKNGIISIDWDLITTAYRKKAEKVTDLQDYIDSQGGAMVYDTKAEADGIRVINKGYDEAIKKLKEKTLSQENYNKVLKKLDIWKLEKLIALYDKLGRTDMANKYRDELAALTKVSEGWRKMVNNALSSGFGASGRGGGAASLWAEESDSYSEYVENLKKDYKTQKALLADQQKTMAKAKEDLKNGLISQADYKKIEDSLNQTTTLIKAIETVGKALGVNISEKIKTQKTASQGKSAEQIALETKIETVKDLVKWYDKLREVGVDDKTAKSLINQYLPGNEDIVNAGNFKQLLLELADALEKYGAAEKKTAQGIRDDVGGKGIQSAYESYKTLDETRKKMQDKITSWIPLEGLEGEDATYKINLAVANYTKSIKEIAQKEIEAYKAVAEWRDASINALGKNAVPTDLGKTEEEQISGKADIDRATAKAKAIEAIRQAVKAYYKEWRNGAMDFANLSDKSISQLRDMKAAIEGFNIDTLDDETVKRLKELGVNIEDLIKLLDKLKDQDIDILDSERGKQTAANIREIASAVVDLGSSLEELGEKSGNKNLESLGEVFNTFGKTTLEFVGKIATGDYLGAAISLFSNVANIIIEDLTYSAELAQSIRNVRIEAEAARLGSLSTISPSVFGDDSTAQAKAYAKALREVIADMDKLHISSTQTFGGMLKNYELTGKFNEWVVNIGKSSGFPTKSLDYLAKELGYAETMVDSYGMLNTDFLQAILDTYSKLDSEDREWITSAIEYIKIYEQAIDDLRSSIEDYFGDLASSISDKFIEAFLATGDAASDLTDIFDEVGQSIAKNLIMNMLLSKEVLGGYQDELLKLFKETDTISEEEYARRIAELVNGIKGAAENASSLATAILSGLQTAGLSLGSASGTSDLSNGIKSITEDTANLLASYVNAIRADVSASRVSISDIQQTNLRIAVASESILARLNDTIGAFSGGGDGFKIIMS